MTTLDDLAPYPKRMKDVTADGLVRHMLVSAHAGAMQSADLAGAMMRAEGTDGYADAYRMYQRNIEAYTAEYGVALLLRTLIDHLPDRVERVARELWERWDDAPMGGHTWSALRAYGIDPGAVEDVLRASEADTAGAAK